MYRRRTRPPIYLEPMIQVYIPMQDQPNQWFAKYLKYKRLEMSSLFNTTSEKALWRKYSKIITELNND